MNRPWESPKKELGVSLLLFLVGVIGIIAGAVGGQSFIDSNFVQEPSDDRGWTGIQFSGLVLQTVAMPLGFCCFPVSTLLFVRSSDSAVPLLAKVSVIAVAQLVAVAASIAAALLLSSPLLKCGVFCTDYPVPSDDDDGSYGYYGGYGYYYDDYAGLGGDDVSTTRTLRQLGSVGERKSRLETQPYPMITGLIYACVALGFAGWLTIVQASLVRRYYKQASTAAEFPAGAALVAGKNTSKTANARSNFTGSQSRSNMISSPLLTGDALLVAGRTGLSASSAQVDDSIKKALASDDKASVILAACGFLAVMPFALLCSGYFGNAWQQFTPSIIEQSAHESQKVYKSYGASISLGFAIRIDVGSGVWIKLWPDVLAFYAFLYSAAAFALASRWSCRFRRFLHWRVFGSVSGYMRSRTLGEVLLLVGLTSLLAFETCYFSTWRPTWGGAANDASYPRWERWARTMGQVANCLIGLLFLPASRNSIWTTIFGVPWEQSIIFHRALGQLFLLSIVLHIAFWCAAFEAQGNFPKGIFWTKSYGYIMPPYNDFTVNLATITMCLVFPGMGVGALKVIRRNFFEVFYYIHHLYLSLVIMVLWHSPSSWYYLIGGLFFWIADRTLRLRQTVLINECAEVQITVAAPSVTILAYTTVNRSSEDFAVPSHLPSKPGQYCFINIPSVSLFEWHPFTISSVAGMDRATTHHIKDMGPSTFTGNLHALAKTLDDNTDTDVVPRVVVNVEGPYGAPIDAKHYRSILMVAGGIGITPVVSQFRALRWQKQLGLLPDLKRVRLVWSAREAATMDLFLDDLVPFEMAEDFELCNQNQDALAFSVSLWLTGQQGGQNAEALLPLQEPSPSSSSVASFGRPDLLSEFKALVQGAGSVGEDTLAFVCGPRGMINEVERLSVEAGVEFHAETFEL